MRGFTLIEAIIYIALLSVLMAGVLLATYSIFQTSGSLSSKTIVQEEGNFVLRKIDWALTGTSSLSLVTTPAPGAYASALSLTRYDGTQIDIRLNNATQLIELREGGLGGTYYPITTANVSATNLQFHYLAPSGTGPAGIEASTTINGIVFYTEKYFRQ